MPTLSEAFSPQHYLQFAPQGFETVFNAAASDYSGLIQESTHRPTVYQMQVDLDSNLISWRVPVPDPQSPQGFRYQTYSPDVTAHLSADPTLTPAQKIFALATDPQNYDSHHRLLYYWSSPPQPDKYPEYKENRTEIGLLTLDPVKGQVVGQTISNVSPNWSGSDCQFWFERFTGKYDNPSLDEIRNTPLLLHPPLNLDPLNWFCQEIGKSELAADFYTGRLETQQIENLRQISAQCSMFSIAVMELYSKGHTDYRPQALYQAVTAAAGGPLSSTCLVESKASSGEKHYVHNCGKCGTTIEAWISKNYVCPKCGGVYEGC